MDKLLSVCQVIAPIFLALALGALARKKALLSPQEVRGMQQYVMKFGLPCVVFHSCLTANMGIQSLGSMALVLAAVAVSTAWAFRSRKGRYPYHNLPMLFAAQETGMLGIPLFVILFGAGEAYRMGVLDLAQAVTAYPVIALLTADTGENPTPPQILKKMLASPLLILSLLGLVLNLTGLFRWLEAIGIGAVLTESVSFLGQPISAMMIFSVGYNFSLAKDCRREIVRISVIHGAMFLAFCALIQLALFLVPGVDALTRWVTVLYCALPASYLASGMGRNDREVRIASGVSSVLTLYCLGVFCFIAAAVA